MRFLQCNLNHCQLAQDLVTQRVSDERLDVVAVADGYGLVDGKGGWIVAGRAALGIFGSRVTVSNIEKDREFVSARLNGIQVYSCYASSNVPMTNFMAFLDRLETSIRGLGRGVQVLVAGDLNARSAAWGDWTTNVRGEELAAMLDSLNLVVMNEGSKPTFVGIGAGSVIDVTLASEALARRVTDWRVLGVFNGSDHQYIEYSVQSHDSIESPRRTLSHNGWDTTRGIDLTTFKTGYLLARWGRDESDSLPTLEEMPEELAERFEKQVAAACDFSLPRRKGPPHGKPPAHWWTEEIASLRTGCIEARRAVKRRAARAVTRDVNDEVMVRLTDVLKEARKKLKIAIRLSKKRCWNELIASVDRDPWGRPYKVVMRKLQGAPPTANMEIGIIREVTGGLFPDHSRMVLDEIPPLPLEAGSEFSQAEVDVAVERIKGRKKAPGPDGLNSRIIAAVHAVDPQRLRRLFNACLRTGRFPARWKQARLVLLKKGNKPADVPSSYRPLCLLNDVGKLLEYLLVRRLESHVAEKGNLSDAQYGFRRGRSTDDACNRLRDTAQRAVNNYDACVAVSLDIKNAFNAIGWRHIMSALETWGVPVPLRRMFRSYFSERGAELQCPHLDGSVSVQVTCGVPQGSVVGPFLWNITYDKVLNTQMPEGSTVIGFADDTLVIASGGSIAEVESRLAESLDRIAEEIRGLGLSLAVEKTEAVSFRRNYKDPAPRVSLMGTQVPVSETMNYLGILVDKNLMFKQHIRAAAEKGQRVLTALSRLMPNMGGPKEVRRRLLSSVVHSVMLYGAPVWASALPYIKASVDGLAKVQRRTLLRNVSAYRTVSRTAANVLAAVPPIELLAAQREEAHYKRREQGSGDSDWKMVLKRQTLNRWKGQLEIAETGEWTRLLVHDLGRWTGRPHGQMDFHLTQIMSGHGCFGKYLFKIKRAGGQECCHCPALMDDAAHTLLECPAWDEQRGRLSRSIGRIEVSTLVEKMLRDRSSWEAVKRFANEVMLRKEEAERTRQGQPQRGGTVG